MFMKIALQIKVIFLKNSSKNYNNFVFLNSKSCMIYLKKIYKNIIFFI